MEELTERTQTRFIPLPGAAHLLFFACPRYHLLAYLANYQMKLSGELCARQWQLHDGRKVLRPYDQVVGNIGG